MTSGFPTEGGLRVPAFVNSGVLARQGERNGELMTPMDVAATLLDLAGIDIANHATARHMRGQSLLPYLRGTRDEAFGGDRTTGWEMFSNRALHQGDWKIAWIWTPSGEAAWQLYDLTSDPAETIDLADQYPERLQAMIEEWHRYAQETGVVPLDRDVGGFSSWQFIHD